MKEEVFAPHICKRCESIFVSLDESGNTDIPSRSKYCPKCESEGFKNKHKRNYSEESIKKATERLKKYRDDKKKGSK